LARQLRRPRSVSSSGDQTALRSKSDAYSEAYFALELRSGNSAAAVFERGSQPSFRSITSRRSSLFAQPGDRRVYRPRQLPSAPGCWQNLAQSPPEQPKDVAEMPPISYFPEVEHLGLILRKIKHCKGMPNILEGILFRRRGHCRKFWHENRVTYCEDRRRMMR
jgi:hypothetical protein